MIKIARVTMREIRLPLAEPFVTAGGIVEQRRVLLLEVSDADGFTAWTECVAESLPEYSPETVDSCWLALSEWILPAALHERFASAAAVDHALENRVRGNRMARATIEMGVWALESSHRGMPLAEVLVEYSDAALNQMSAPRQFVETGIALGIHDTPESLAERAETEVSAGYRRIKLKISPSRDVEFVRAVRSSVGPDIVLTVDANCSYNDADASDLSALMSLDAFGLRMIEQPLAHDDLVHHANLQRLLSTPICLDESITCAASVEEMLVLGSAKVVNLKPGRVGGFRQSLAIHDLCADSGVPVWCGGMLETGVGRAYNVALASLKNFTEPGDLSPSSRYWPRDIVAEPWRMDADGRVKVPLDRAGIGVDVDEGWVDDLTVRRAVFTAK